MKIAIIGAGFSGCNLYNNLKEKYEDITIFEKSRDSRCETGTQYGRNIPACNDNIISQ
jgi:predicted NAD/FAD-dependent oxidoreductase